MKGSTGLLAFAWGSVVGITSAVRGGRPNLPVCPIACADASSATGNWDVYSSIHQLGRCNETMLVSFNIHNALNDPNTHKRLAACTAAKPSGKSSAHARALEDGHQARAESTIDNSNATSSVALPASAAVVQVQQASSGKHDGSLSSDLESAARALHAHTLTTNQTRDTILFAYSNGAVAGVYSGKKVNSTSTQALLQQLVESVLKSTAKTVIIQVCGQDRNSDYAMGVIAVAGGAALSTAQNAVASWNQAKCVNTESSSVLVSTMTVDQVPKTPVTHHAGSSHKLARQSYCFPTKVQSGDTCWSLATYCGISLTDFETYNPGSTFCSTLVPGQWVCCTAGTLPDMSPQPNADGSCHSYYVQPGDTCSQLAASNSLTVDKIDFYNNNTWGWMGCNDLMADMNICLSTGTPPMPAPITNAVCGPQVPGTSPPPAGWTLAQLNQCPLNSCCDIWGQCGTTPEFCTASQSTTGAPGTAAPGQNGCISNCGTDIVYSAPPASVMNIGYFEGFNLNRPCLKMDASQISSSYTHVHFAFANISSNFQVDVSGSAYEFQQFASQTRFKRILSIGGWAFSTDPSTYNIFREAVQDANRGTLVASIVQIVNEYGLDGIDIDWEYPGEPDIPGIPAGSSVDGLYLWELLVQLKGALPSWTTLSITAPSSYWYLRGFPIQSIASTVDYVVYMTYDLHGQWDYANKWSDDGCPTGSCLRSHVNLTETLYALAMITKAGVPSNKIAVGVASHARTFGMVDPNCPGVNCFFTGPASGAVPGPCTQTAGYMALAEINSIVDDTTISKVQYVDGISNSNIMVWDGNWAGYMDESIMATRRQLYAAFNMAGSAEWAIDLESYQPNLGGIFSTSDPNVLDWRTHSCTDPNVNNPDSDPASRWAAAGCDTAWAEWLTVWNTEGFSEKFPRHTSDWFKGPMDYDCDVLTNLNGCDGDNLQCDNGADFGPAAQFILNSFKEMSRSFVNAYNGIQNAQTDLGLQVSAFADTFAPPVVDDMVWLKTLVDILGLTWAVFSAVYFKIVLNGFKFGVEGSIDALSLSLNAMVVAGGNLIKDNVAIGTTLVWEGELSWTIGNMTMQWHNMLTQLNAKIMAADSVDIATFWTMINHGQWISNTITTPTLENVTVAAENAMLATLIPEAWTLSNHAAFLLDTGLACGTTETDLQLAGFNLDATVAEQTMCCYDNMLYHLVSATGPAKTLTTVDHSPPYYVDNNFNVPPGISSIDGKTWGNFDLADFVTCAFSGWANNGKTNGWNYPDPSTPAGGEIFVNHVLTSTALLPGSVRVPVCSGTEAFNNWAAVTINGGSPSANYPCN